MDDNKQYSKEKEEIMKYLLKIFQKYEDVTTDTRTIKKGSIFFGLKGENFDGNSFANKALSLGAEAVVIDNKDYYINDKTILVEDSLSCLQDFASYYRKTLTIPIFAISGTNGKTTTKELIHTILSTKYKTSATVGNLNNQIGVPLTLLKIKKDDQIAIVEMGASHLKDIEFLCNIAQPTCGLLTNVGTAHIAGFGSLEGVVQTKTELYRFLNSRKGKVFVNFDDENLKKQQVENKTTYSLKTKADIQAKIINQESPFAEIEIDNQEIHSNLIGGYNCYNILAAICVGKYFDVSLSLMKNAIESYQPNNNRSQIKKTDRNTLILDCYNANPSSCKEAINAFSKIKADEKRVFIGAMKELGTVSEKEHKAIADLLNSLSLKQIIFVGDEYKQYATQKNNVWFQTSNEAKNYIINNEQIKDSLILIKGSRATQMENLVDVL